VSSPEEGPTLKAACAARNVIAAEEPIGMLAAVTSTALYVTVSLCASVTVKVATPFAFVIAGDVVITDEPAPAVNVTF
jgi:hypothetical protein